MKSTQRKVRPNKYRLRPADQQPKDRGDLAQTFLNRSVKMLQRISSAASPETLKVALAAPTDMGGVASLLSDLAPLGLDLSAVDPFVEAVAHGAVVKRELLESSGGVLTSSQVGRVLGITRQAVDKRRTRRALLAVPAGSGEYLYPACQFAAEGSIPGLERVLRAFRVHNPWTQLSTLLAPTPALENRTILDALRNGEAQKAAAVAASFGEQGA